jgi:peptidoglycan/xylan/chitin deacetylase (PgdA/CDA1 family)
MNAETRARCLRTAYGRLVIALLPLLMVGWLVSLDQILAAALLFCTVLTLMMIGTLMPRCALFGPMIKQLPGGSGHALLTIDDGPHPEHTPAILDILDQHQLKAIFFLIGERAALHPELVREIVARGHEIGNHTQTHPAARFWALTPATLWREIADCQETLTSICPDHPPRFFRPPAGHHNVFTFVISQALGLKMLMWSARGFDGVMQDVKFITDRIRARLKPGAIVLIHEATPVAIEVAESIARMMAESGLKCGASALPRSDDC